MRLAHRAVATVIAVGVNLGCNETPKAQPQPNEPSPNASILPAPLASALEPAQKGALVDAGTSLDAAVDAGPSGPETLREDRPPTRDPLARLEGPLREAQAVRLSAEFRWLDLPAFPRPPEANAEGHQRLRDALTFGVTIDLSAAGRLRLRFDSELFVLPQGSELRAREDYFGHLFSFHEGQSYAVIPVGTLRALLVEGRADAAPLSKPKVVELGAGNVLGMPTSKRELGTPLGRLAIEQASLTSGGAGSTLLCRLLVELIAAEPANSVCARRELPLRAELFSNGGGHVAFEVKKIERDATLDPAELFMPPSEATFTLGELPAPGSRIFLDSARLRELRTRAAPRSDRPEPSAPKQGLTIQNRTESLRYVLLDGLVIARVPPRKEVHVDALLPGKYSLTSLDFLGDDVTPLRVFELPARLSLGELVETER